MWSIDPRDVPSGRDDSARESLLQVVFTRGTLEQPAMTCQARPQGWRPCRPFLVCDTHSRSECVCVCVERERERERERETERERERETDRERQAERASESAHTFVCSCMFLVPRKSDGSSSADGEVFGELPPRAELLAHTRFPVCPSAPAPYLASVASQPRLKRSDAFRVSRNAAENLCVTWGRCLSPRPLQAT